jgi:hypothetical protein
LRWPVLLILLEPLRVKKLLLQAPPIIKNSFISIDNQPLLVKPVLIAYDFLEFLICLPLNLIALIFNLFLNLCHIDTLLALHRIQMLLEPIDVRLNGLNGLLSLISLLLLPILLVVV